MRIERKYGEVRFVGSGYFATVYYWENKRGRFPVIRIWRNEDTEDGPFIELYDIMDNVKVHFISLVSGKSSAVPLCQMPVIMLFIDFFMNEVRKDNSLIDVSRL